MRHRLPSSAPPSIDYHRQVPGWFDFEQVYDLLVASAHSGEAIVEVGCFQGRSTCYLASLAKRACKDLVVFAVDTFKGSPEQAGDPILPRLQEIFLRHIAAAGCLDIVRTIPLDSVTAASLFPDNSLASCFIDACHLFDAVQADILAWLPKIREGGILGGHDYLGPWLDVKTVVDALFPGAVTVVGQSWAVRVSQGRGRRL